MIRKLVFLLCAAVALVAAPSRLSAEENDIGFKFYEKQAITVLKAAGAKIWGAADDARKFNLFQFTKEQAERALEFDPNLEEARDYLGFVKKEGKWVPDAEKTAKVPLLNTKPQTRSDAAQAEVQKKWEDESLKPADKYCARLYAELGDACAAKGYKDQADKGYEAALCLDKENEKARKGLGYTRFGKTWVTKKQDDARKAASKAEVIKETELNVWDDMFGKRLNKVESRHYRFESAYDVAELTLYATACETAYAYYLADFGKDPSEDVLEGRHTMFVVCTDDKQWDALVDRFGGPDKEFTRKLGGVSLGAGGHGVRSDKGSNLESRRDLIVHQAIHELNRIIWKIDKHAWLNEGLAYYYTLKVLESCLCFCVAQSKGDYAGKKDEGGMKDWGKTDSWKTLLKDQVKKKDDLPLRSLSMLPITKLEFEPSVKAWSLVSWFMDTDRDKFINALDQMLDPAIKQDNVIQGMYGKGYEDLDEMWHAYVRKCY